MADCSDRLVRLHEVADERDGPRVGAERVGVGKATRQPCGRSYSSSLFSYSYDVRGIPGLTPHRQPRLPAVRELGGEGAKAATWSTPKLRRTKSLGARCRAKARIMERTLWPRKRSATKPPTGSMTRRWKTAFQPATRRRIPAWWVRVADASNPPSGRPHTGVTMRTGRTGHPPMIGTPRKRPTTAKIRRRPLAVRRGVVPVPCAWPLPCVSPAQVSGARGPSARFAPRGPGSLSTRPSGRSRCRARAARSVAA